MNLSLATDASFYRKQSSSGSDPAHDVRFLFQVENVDSIKQESKYSTIQSVQTKKFLISDESGKASMKEEETYKKDQPKGTTKDRQAWFRLIKIEDTVTDNLLTVKKKILSLQPEILKSSELLSVFVKNCLLLFNCFVIILPCKLNIYIKLAKR